MKDKAPVIDVSRAGYCKVGPKMAQNSTKMAKNGSKSPEWLKMALHDPK